MGGMSDDKPVEPEAVEEPTAPLEEPVSPEPAPEPKKPRRKPKRAPYAVVGDGPTDVVLYSRARIPSAVEGRKSLTVLHIQRALRELGIPAGTGGRWTSVTTGAVSQYQTAHGDAPTGVLTRAQFAALFDDDPNVTVSIDTHADHAG